MPVYKQTEAFNKCLTKVIFPAGNTKLQDGNATSGVEDYKEFWYSLVGLSGIGQSFDGNGTFTKFLVGNSGATLKSAPATLIGKNLKGSTCSPTRRCRRRARARPSRPPSRPTSRWCPATSRRCRNSTARCPADRRTGRR